jgi:hypothetical protein
MLEAPGITLPVNAWDWIVQLTKGSVTAVATGPKLSEIVECLPPDTEIAISTVFPDSDMIA